MSYRVKLANKLELDFNYEIDNRIMNYIEGGASSGSSFDGLIYDGKATKMKVNERWKVYKDNNDYKSLFDKRLIKVLLSLDLMYERRE